MAPNIAKVVCNPLPFEEQRSEPMCAFRKITAGHGFQSDTVCNTVSNRSITRNPSCEPGTVFPLKRLESFLNAFVQ